MPHVLLVTGARELLCHPGAHAYVCWRVGWLAGELGASLILHGGALGPDTWAGETAERLGLRAVTYLPNGWRLDTHAPPRRWAADGADPGPLVRNRAMVDAPLSAGWPLTVLGFLTPWQPATHGTAATLRYARQRGAEVHEDVVPACVGWLTREDYDRWAGGAG